jgi:MFS family permease
VLRTDQESLGGLRRLGHNVAGQLDLSYERWVMTLLLLALVVDYADRTLIGALGPTLEHTFNLSHLQLGLLAAAFGLVSAVATAPIGLLTDRTNRTRLLAMSLVIWTVGMGLTGAAVSFTMLFGARLLLGVVSATTGPAVPSLTGDLVPARERARALGFIDSGQLIGSGVGFLLAAIVVAFLYFRWCFWLLGIAGAALAVAYWAAREPERTGPAGKTDGDGDKEEAHSCAALASSS